MGPLRASVRLVGLILLTPVCYFGCVLARLLLRKGSRTQLNQLAFWQRLWARTCCRLLGIRVQAEGPAPQRPFVLVGNHLSYLDIIVYWCCVRAQFLSKAEVAQWPIMGTLARGAGTLFVDRLRRADLARVRAEAVDVLKQGHGLIFFPEGTSSPGAEVMPFKASLFQVALDAELPVHTVSIRYLTPPSATPAYESVCWWGDMEFAPHFWALLKLRRVDATLRFSEQAVQAGDRKTLARLAQQAVTDSFVAIPGAPSMTWTGPTTS
jgi:1-acyl-sn-glycerol-3-phosphate acyltransferase